MIFIGLILNEKHKNETFKNANTFISCNVTLQEKCFTEEQYKKTFFSVIQSLTQGVQQGQK